MNNYELTVVLAGKTTAAKKKSAGEKLEKMIEALEGKVVKKTDMGEKKLAYPIAKNTAGIYLFYNLKLSGEAAKKISDKLRVEDTFLRYLLIKTQDSEE